jgi:hypothetical protein
MLHRESLKLIPIDEPLPKDGSVTCFLVFHQLTRKHLALLVDVVSGFKSFSEAPHLARKCGTRRSDSSIRAL